MKVFKTLVSFSDGDPLSFVQVDTIEREGGLCLVLEWVQEPDGRSRKPAKIIRLDRSEYHQMTGNPNGDFVLTRSISKAVFEGRQSEAPYIVAERQEPKE